MIAEDEERSDEEVDHIFRTEIFGQDKTASALGILRSFRPELHQQLTQEEE